jgi:hypothetical protein
MAGDLSVGLVYPANFLQAFAGLDYAVIEPNIYGIRNKPRLQLVRAELLVDTDKCSVAVI